MDNGRHVTLNNEDIPTWYVFIPRKQKTDTEAKTTTMLILIAIVLFKTVRG